MQTVTQPSEPLYWGERKHDAPTRVDVFGKLCADSPHRWIGRLEAKTGPSNPIRPQTLAYHHPQAKIQTHKNGQGAANGLRNNSSPKDNYLFTETCDRLRNKDSLMDWDSLMGCQGAQTTKMSRAGWTLPIYFQVSWSSWASFWLWAPWKYIKLSQTIKLSLLF